jgi:hypothetical protein
VVPGIGENDAQLFCSAALAYRHVANIGMALLPG